MEKELSSAKLDFPACAGILFQICVMLGFVYCIRVELNAGNIPIENRQTLLLTALGLVGVASGENFSSIWRMSVASFASLVVAFYLSDLMERGYLILILFMSVPLFIIRRIVLAQTKKANL